MADMSTMNTRVGWAANANSSLQWFGDNAKPTYRAYNLGNVAGHYWYQSNMSGWTWSVVNCTAFHSAWSANCAQNCRYSLYYTVYRNCCQDAALGGNCNCNCTNNCGNCYPGNCGGAVALSGGGQCAECAQCNVGGNCDSRTWMQPNCNCMQCNCACNCFGAGQCIDYPNCNCAGK